MLSFIKKKILFLLPLSILSACTSSPQSYQMPKQSDVQGYTIIDAVDKMSLDLHVDKKERIAIVVRDISTTSYSYLEPRYSNSMVSFDGKSSCCLPAEMTMGNTGLLVYRFSFFGEGNTDIHLLSRQKGLSSTASAFDSDHVLSIHVNVD